VNRRDKLPLHLFPKIDPGTGKRWSLADQGKAALNEICDSLNSKTRRELRFRLRAWVQAWQASGPNLERMTKDFAERDRFALTVALRTHWHQTSGAGAELLLLPDYPTMAEFLGEERVWLNGPPGESNSWEPTPEARAMMLFHLLTINPLCEKLAGPCPRCDRYYVKKRASQKVYCSRRCGNAATAVERTRERIAGERGEKLARARAAIKKWKATATQQDWKVWVASKTGIDQRFLTRAITKGDLVPPKQEK
jgi:hypothetical protein